MWGANLLMTTETTKRLTTPALPLVPSLLSNSPFNMPEYRKIKDELGLKPFVPVQ